MSNQQVATDLQSLLDTFYICALVSKNRTLVSECRCIFRFWSFLAASQVAVVFFSTFSHNKQTIDFLSGQKPVSQKGTEGPFQVDRGRPTGLCLVMLMLMLICDLLKLQNSWTPGIVSKTQTCKHVHLGEPSHTNSSLTSRMDSQPSRFSRHQWPKVAILMMIWFVFRVTSTLESMMWTSALAPWP